MSTRAGHQTNVLPAQTLATQSPTVHGPRLARQQSVAVPSGYRVRTRRRAVVGRSRDDQRGRDLLGRGLDPVSTDRRADLRHRFALSLCRSVTAVFSRARELEAAAAAALFTGNPAALASALIALSGTPRQLIPLTDLGQAASLDVFHIVAIANERPLLHTARAMRQPSLGRLSLLARPEHACAFV